MSDASFSESVSSRSGEMSAPFAQLVLQQTNLALMLLGQAPNPQTGETTRDLEGARMFIDQLEMLEAKTRGNLSKDEAALLQRSLMSVRLAFVETVETPAPAAPEPAAPPAGTSAAPGAAPTDAEADSKKKFSKKY